jgi:hypothetical protein
VAAPFTVEEGGRGDAPKAVASSAGGRFWIRRFRCWRHGRYPWGQEAFAKAEAEGKPIMLSVGYRSVG